MGQKVQAVIEYQRRSVIDSVTRPANTTAYAAGDVVSDATADAHLTFAGAVLPSGSRYSGSIATARVTSSANQGTKPDLELWLFHTDIATVADNAAFAPTDAEMLTRIGVIDFAVANWKTGAAGAGAAGNSCCEVSAPGVAFKAADRNIYGQLVVRNAYTPVSGEIFTVELVITQD